MGSSAGWVADAWSCSGAVVDFTGGAVVDWSSAGAAVDWSCSGAAIGKYVKGAVVGC